MRLARFNGGRIGVCLADEIADITELCGIDPNEWPPVGPLRLIRDFEALRPRIEAGLANVARLPLEQALLEAPVPWPSKVIAYPVNYHAHGREMQADYRATNQGFFLKPGSSVSGPNDPVELPQVPSRFVAFRATTGATPCLVMHACSTWSFADERNACSGRPMTHSVRLAPGS
jgi:hypothetical protein